MICILKWKLVYKTSIIFLIGLCFLFIIDGTGFVRVAWTEVSSDEGKIVFKRWVNGKGTIWVMSADGRNQTQLTDGDDHRLGHNSPRWSPDGKKIVFHAPDGINIMDADGSNIRQITNGPDDYNPAWSPDGSQIAFSKELWEEKDGKSNFISGGIYVIDTDGGNLRKLTDGYCRGADWSPDGKKIAYSFGYAPPQIYVIDANGEHQKMIFDWGSNPAWSPDGEKIAFHSERDNHKTCDIYVMDSNGQNVKRLTESSQSDEFYPRWSPDGKSIAFSSNMAQLSNWDLYIMDSDGQNTRQITDTWEREFELDWIGIPYAINSYGKLYVNWGKIKAK